MANRKDLRTLLIVGALSLLVAIAGLYLGFNSNRRAAAPPLPSVPETGPIVYGMRSVVSDPGRVRLEWREVSGAGAYEVTLMTASDDSLFTSPAIQTTAWTIPPELRSRLQPQTVYHWRLAVIYPDGRQEISEPAAFATQ